MPLNAPVPYQTVKRSSSPVLRTRMRLPPIATSVAHVAVSGAVNVHRV